MTEEEKLEKILKCPRCDKYATRPVVTKVGNSIHTQCNYCGELIKVDYLYDS